MRDIKFRFWDANEEVMINPASITDLYLGNPKHLILETDIPMQYTGLTDKNGVEIYEGDLLDAKVMPVQEVMYLNGCFDVRSVPDNDDWTHLKDWLAELDAVVIGNIYVNKELLK